MCVPTFDMAVAAAFEAQRRNQGRKPAKPRLVKSHGQWYCGKLAGQGPQIVEYPVGFGPTPQVAYKNWKAEQ